MGSDEYDKSGGHHAGYNAQRHDLCLETHNLTIIVPVVGGEERKTQVI